MRLVVNRDRCQGVGLCEVAAADVIEVGDDGQSHVLVDELMPEHLPAAQVAVANCPTEALLLEE
jgi:ferredoxin